MSGCKKKRREKRPLVDDDDDASREPVLGSAVSVRGASVLIESHNGLVDGRAREQYVKSCEEIVVVDARTSGLPNLRVCESATKYNRDARARQRINANIASLERCVYTHLNACVNRFACACASFLNDRTSWVRRRAWRAGYINSVTAANSNVRLI